MERRRLLKIIGLIIVFNFVSYIPALVIVEDCMNYSYGLRSSSLSHVVSVYGRMSNIDRLPFTIHDWWAGYGLLAEGIYLEILLRI